MVVTRKEIIVPLASTCKTGEGKPLDEVANEDEIVVFAHARETDYVAGKLDTRSPYSPSRFFITGLHGEWTCTYARVVEERTYVSLTREIFSNE